MNAKRGRVDDRSQLLYIRKLFRQRTTPNLLSLFFRGERSCGQTCEHTRTHTHRPRSYTRRGIYKTFTLFLSQWWYHYRTARHVIPACTCPDYLYDGRRSLPRREKYTLDAGKLAAYTLVSFGRVSCSQDTRSRVCVCTCVCVCLHALCIYLAGLFAAYRRFPSNVDALPQNSQREPRRQ